MKKCLMIAAVLAVSCCLAACDSKFNPSLKLSKGAIYNGSITTDQNIEQTYMGTSQKNKEKNTFEFHIEVTEVQADGNMVLQFIYDRFLMKSENNGQTSEYDSTNPGGATNPMSAIIGHTITMIMTPRGDVTKVTGLERLYDKITSQFGDLPAETKQQVLDGLKQQFGDESMKQMLGQQMTMYPDNPVAIGESWEKKFSLTSGMAMNIDNKLTLNKYEGDLATISIVSTVSPNQSGAPMTIGDVKIGYNLTGTQTGEMTMETKTGMVSRSSLHQKLEGTLKMEMSGQNMEVPIKIEGDTILELTPKK